MRLLSIITKFPDYINDHYHRHPNIIHQSYQDQYQALVDDNLGSFETWSEGLSRLGYETDRIFATIPEIQKQWAKEQDIVYEEANWLENIVRAQIFIYQPEILVVGKQSTFKPGFIKKIRAETPSIRLIISWCGSPFKNLDIFQEYDFILSSIPELVEEFKSKGLKCYHLNHSFDPRVLAKIDAHMEPVINFSFSGAVVKSPGYHFEREIILLELIKATDIEIWSDIRSLTRKQKIKKLLTLSTYNAIQSLVRMGISKNQLSKIPYLGQFSSEGNRPDYSSYVDCRIAKHARPPVFGISMYQTLHNSKVTLNIHGDNSSLSASNMRLYEATGVCTCLLTDWKKNIKELFEPDIDVITYKNPPECIEKVRYLLQNDGTRRLIAEAGQKRTLNNHTIYHRAEQLDQIIREFLRNH